MSAWWSSTFLLLTTRPSGSLSSESTYCADLEYAAFRPTSAAVGLISAIWSLGRNRELVRGYVIALCSSYSRWAAASVRRAENPKSVLAWRGRELGHLGPGPQMLERPLDGLARHRREPQPLYRLVDTGRLVKVGEDELTLAARVAGVHDQLDVVVAHELVDRLELLLGPLVDRDQLELLGQDRQVGEPPALELRVVLVRSRESHQVADRP